MTATDVPRPSPDPGQHRARTPSRPRGDPGQAPSRLPVDDERAPLYSTGQVGAMLGVRQAFLRRLDQLQVVRPRRSTAGQRRYSRREIERIAQVVALVDEGVSLAAVGRILRLQQQLAEAHRELTELHRRLKGRVEGPGNGHTGHSELKDR
jgi:MerR family transcriptional regulator/heat shock protein HspR